MFSRGSVCVYMRQIDFIFHKYIFVGLYCRDLRFYSPEMIKSLFQKSPAQIGLFFCKET